MKAFSDYKVQSKFQSSLKKFKLNLDRGLLNAPGVPIERYVSYEYVDGLFHFLLDLGVDREKLLEAWNSFLVEVYTKLNNTITDDIDKLDWHMEQSRKEEVIRNMNCCLEFREKMYRYCGDQCNVFTGDTDNIADVL